MPPLQITVVVSGRVGDLVKGRNTAGQSQLLRAQESVLRTFSMTLLAPAVDFSGDPGSCHIGRERVGCPVRAACTKENAHSAEQTASRV